MEQIYKSTLAEGETNFHFVCVLGTFWKRTNTKLQILLLESYGGTKYHQSVSSSYRSSCLEKMATKKHCFGLFLSQVLQVSQVQVRVI